MSPVRQIEALWSTYQSGGARATVARLAEDCELVPPDDVPVEGVVRGTGAIRAYLDRLDHDGVRIEPAVHTCEALGADTVLVGGRMRIVRPASLSDSPLFWLCRLRGGAVVRIESYSCRADALEAAGVER